MKQYINLVNNILKNGVEKESGRANMPNTLEISKSSIKMDLKNGFPLLTTKKMYWKGIVHELLWFLRGDTNIKYLVNNNVNIWNDDAYRWYNDKYVKLGAPIISFDEFIDNVKRGKKTKVNNPNPTKEHPYERYVTYTYGDLDKVYGYQWRNQNGIDQVKDVIDGLKNNPYSRYHIINAWNKSDFNNMALPPCHLLYHFIVRPLTKKERIKYAVKELKLPKMLFETNLDLLETNNIPKFYLDLNMYQRSCDVALGVPYNLASMSLLLMLMAKACNMIPSVAIWIGGCTHIYLNHIENIKNQTKRKAFELPKMKINKNLNTLEDITNLTIDDFELVNYQSHSKINFELFVGLSKDQKK